MSKSNKKSAPSNAVLKPVDRMLHDEAFALINNGIKSPATIVETLSEILYEDYGFKNNSAIFCANSYLVAHYEEIVAEVEDAQEEAREDYYDRVCSYHESVVGVN